MDPQIHKQLLLIQSILTGIINTLEPTKATLPAGTFAGLATAEGGLTNALGGLGWCGAVRPVYASEPRCSGCGQELHEPEVERGTCDECVTG